MSIKFGSTVVAQNRVSGMFLCQAMNPRFFAHESPESTGRPHFCTTNLCTMNKVPPALKDSSSPWKFAPKFGVPSRKPSVGFKKPRISPQRRSSGHRRKTIISRSISSAAFLPARRIRCAILCKPKNLPSLLSSWISAIFPLSRKDGANCQRSSGPASTTLRRS